MAWLLLGVLSAAAGAAAGWGAPVNLSRTGEHASLPQVAVGAQGTAVAVWQRPNGPHTIVQGAVRPAGRAWQAPRDLSAAGQQALEPQVAVDAHGSAVAIWKRFNGTHFIVQARVRSARGAWQAPVDLSAPGQDAARPQVALDAQGHAVAVWERFNGTDTIVQGAVRPADGTWQAPRDLSAAGQQASGPQVAVDAHGSAVAVWGRLDGTHVIVQATLRLAGGAWQAPVDLSAPGQDASQPQVALDAQRTAVAIWQRFNGSNWIVQGTVRPAGGPWQAPSDLSRAGTSATEPQLAVDAQGIAVAVWQRFNATNNIVQGAVRPADAAWQAPVDLSAPGQNATDPQVAVDAHGTAVAVWQRWNGTNDIVQGTVRPADAAWQVPVDLSAPGQHATDPQVAVDAQGNALAVWARVNGGAYWIVQSATRSTDRS